MAKIQVARVSRLTEPHQNERGDKQEGQKMNHFPCGKAAAHNQGQTPGASPSCFRQPVPWAPAIAAMVSEWPLEEEAPLEPESWGSITSGPGQQPACPVAKSSLTVRKATGAVFPLSTGRPCGLSCIQDPRTQESDLQRKSSICYCALGNGFARSLTRLILNGINTAISEFPAKSWLNQGTKKSGRHADWKGNLRGLLGVPGMSVSWSGSHRYVFLWKFTKHLVYDLCLSLTT